jgi:hypothetical protein
MGILAVGYAKSTGRAAIQCRYMKSDANKGTRNVLYA